MDLTADKPISSPPKKKPDQGGVKDTIESILVAFILAFIFRAFIVEAFVIPTGSMAPTLMGAHMRFKCPDCGYRWSADYRTGETAETPTRANGRVFSLICPNCGYRLPRENKEDPENSATSPAVDFGDRILVLKYLYLFTDPHRWDVCVFKSPAIPGYQVNYIKRLIGKPNESIMVLDGDIYIGHKGDALTDFKVQAKPRSAQEALWRIVYDNDFQPQAAGEPRFVYGADGSVKQRDPSWTQPWVEQQGGSGWSTGSNKPGERVFSFDNPAGSSTLRFEPSSEALNNPLTNWLAYNVTSGQVLGERADMYLSTPFQMFNYVSDLKLDFFYTRHSGKGPLRLTLTKNDDVFVAEVSADRVRLLRYRPDSREIEIGQVPWTAPNRPAHIEFTNVDYRVALRIDDKDLIVSTPDQYSPNIDVRVREHETNTPSQRPSVSLTAADQSATLSHISLWRDVYYTNRGRELLWGTPEHPADLGPDEYFTMGDNSSNSSDARYWPDPIRLPDEELNVDAGRVPGRFMLGKAFFVYWPAGYRIKDRGVVPNFGDMRFIH